jgi:hypothetical protein
MIRQLFILLTLALSLTIHLAADAPPATPGAPPSAPPAPYVNDFQKTPTGKVPEEFTPLAGDFSVKEEAGNRFLEVSPEPVDGDVLLFGPEGLTAADVRARIYATSVGKRFPEFGIGCGDAGGFKLVLMPGEDRIEIRKGDESLTQAEFKGWKSGEWTSFRLRATPAAGGKWRIEGKAWPASAKEPEAWTITYDSAEPPPTGRASVMASPYSETPVRFDDLAVTGK